MNLNIRYFSAAAAAVFAAAELAAADNSTLNLVPYQIPGTPRSYNTKTGEGYGPSSVQTQLRVDVKEQTRLLHFIRDNTDPFVITKAYRLTEANPYAVRGYILGAVNARHTNSSPVQVTALKFNDGTGLLIASAEDYRFKDSPNGEGIDTLVAKLDRADLTFPRKTETFIYFPKINTAANMAEMLRQVGSNELDPEFAVAPDQMLVDGGINAIVIAGPEWSWKHMKRMLDAYDKPMPEVRISYRVLEIYAENDDRLGVDFQSWKNNDGVDLFSAGARIRRNWSTFFTGGVTPTSTKKVEYWNFNPKWNTRYLDFLTSIGKAKLLTSGTLVAKNRELSEIRVNSGFFYDRTDASYTEKNAEFYYTSPNPDIIPRQALDKIMPEDVMYEIMPNLNRSAYYWRMLNNLAGATKYDTEVAEKIEEQLAIINSATATQAQKAAAYQKLQTLLQEEGLTELLNYAYYNRNPITGSTTDQNYDILTNSTPGVIHGKIQLPMVQNGFLFDLAVMPVVTGDSATLDLSMASVSLMGWNSDGSTRSSKSEVSAKVQIGYEGKDFVVGGLKKSESVRSVSGLPFVKDLPVIGLLFSTESESIKQSQLVLIASVSYSPPDGAADPAVIEKLGKIVEGVNKGIESPTGNVFFQQYLLDTDRPE